MNKDNASAPAGASTEASGSGETDKTKQTDSYPKDFVEKLKKEKENFKLRAEELEKKISLENETKLKEKEEWKKFGELKSQELEKIRAEKSDLENRIKTAQINGAVKKELSKLGFDETHSEDFMKLIGESLKQVAIDPDTSTVLGADVVAKEAFQKYSTLGFFKKSTATVNHSASQSVETVNFDNYRNLSYDDKKKYEKQYIEYLKNKGNK